MSEGLGLTVKLDRMNFDPKTRWYDTVSSVKIIEGNRVRIDFYTAAHEFFIIKLVGEGTTVWR